MNPMSVRRAIVPAAGLGSRLRHIDPAVPKEWLLLHGRPMLAYVLDEIASAQISEVLLVLSPAKLPHWRNCCTKPYMQECTASLEIEVALQPAPLGLADAINRGRGFTGSEPFAIMLPDNLLLSRSPPALTILLNTYDALTKHVVGLTLLEAGRERYFSNSGRVDTKKLEDSLYEITYWHKKEAGHFTLRGSGGEIRSVGRHIAGPDFFRYLDMARETAEGEFDDGHVLTKMVEHDTVYGVLCEDEVFDAGNPLGFDRVKRIIETGGTRN
jgi:UTP--glucose-1-phosphate uridylyltransferase